MAKLNLSDRKTILLMSKLEDEILDVIDHRDEFTRGDLQGVVSALVMKILKIGQEMAEQR